MDPNKKNYIKKEKQIYGFSKLYSNILHIIEPKNNEPFCKDINIKPEDKLYRLDIGVPEKLNICKNCLEIKPTKTQKIFEENPNIKKLL